MSGSEILCIGEMLWDALPEGLSLGGAPFNVACHLRAAGFPVAVVSRVGADTLGDDARQLAARYGLATDLIQIDPTLPTGVVRVTVDALGEATFEIVSPAAWDAMESTELLLRRAVAARAIVFGTIAQRHRASRATIERLVDAARESGALVVFDANLRAPYDDRDVVSRSLRRASVVKVTDAELRRLAEWFDLPRGDDRRTAAALAATFGCGTVCVTRGGAGAGLWRDGTWTEHPGFEVRVRDTVGAGDAFLGVLVAGLLNGVESRALLQHANLLGAYVATQPGAVPADQPVRAEDEAPAAPAVIAPPPRAARGEAPPPARRRRRD